MVKDHYAGVQSNDEDVGRVLEAVSSLGKLDPGYESLTTQLAARLEALRRETGDRYAYHPSRTPHLQLIMGPPQEPKPHR